MAKFKILPTTNVRGYFTAKIKGNVTDADVGKPVKLSVDTTDTYELCADGNLIDAFIVGIEPATADGLHLCTLNNGGYVRCKASGTMIVGQLVEAGANAAAGTANTGDLPIISSKAVVTADITTTATGTEISVAVNALLAAMLLPSPSWRVVSGNTTDGNIADGDTTVIIERV